MIKKHIHVLARKTINYINDYSIKNLQDIKEIINNIYESEEYDINDLANCVYVLNYYIKICIEQDRKCYELIKIRKETNKMIKIKYREGYEFTNFDAINQCKIQSKIKNPEEQARNYINVENCQEQYLLYKNIIWTPSIELFNKMKLPIDLPA